MKFTESIKGWLRSVSPSFSLLLECVSHYGESEWGKRMGMLSRIHGAVRDGVVPVCSSLLKSIYRDVAPVPGRPPPSVSPTPSRASSPASSLLQGHPPSNPPAPGRGHPVSSEVQWLSRSLSTRRHSQVLWRGWTMRTTDRCPFPQATGFGMEPSRSVAPPPSRCSDPQGVACVMANDRSRVPCSWECSPRRSLGEFESVVCSSCEIESLSCLCLVELFFEYKRI